MDNINLANSHVCCIINFEKVEHQDEKSNRWHPKETTKCLLQIQSKSFEGTWWHQKQDGKGSARMEQLVLSWKTTPEWWCQEAVGWVEGKVCPLGEQGQVQKKKKRGKRNQARKDQNGEKEGQNSRKEGQIKIKALIDVDVWICGSWDLF